MALTPTLSCVSTHFLSLTLHNMSSICLLSLAGEMTVIISKIGLLLIEKKL